MSAPAFLALCTVLLVVRNVEVAAAVGVVTADARASELPPPRVVRHFIPPSPFPLDRWVEEILPVKAEVQADTSARPRVESARVESTRLRSLKVHPVQAVGFKYQPAPPYVPVVGNQTLLHLSLPVTRCRLNRHISLTPR